MKTGARRGLLVAAAFFAVTSSASATTWCVKNPTCPAGANSSQTTISGAVTAAAASGDTILIGPGKFNEPVGTGVKTIDFVGAGSSQTVIQSPVPNSTTFAAGTGGSIEDLGIELSGRTGSRGLVFTGDAARVAVTAPTGTTSGTGVILIGGSFDNGSVMLPVTAGNTAVSAAPAPGGSVQDSILTAGTGVDSVTSLARDRITATRGIVAGNGTPGGPTSVDYAIADTLIRTVPGGAAEVGVSLAFPSNASGTVFSNVAIRHITVVGSGAVGSTGIALSSAASGVGNSIAAAQIDSSIVRGYSTSLRRSAAGGGGGGIDANLRVDYSDFDPATIASTNTGVPAGTGAVTPGGHDLNVDPGFVSLSSSDPSAFRLLATSPMIDAGRHSLAAGESPTDVAGSPRFVAGTALGKPISDIGAFEYLPHAPSVTALAPAFALAGRSLAFTATGSDSDPGDVLSYSWHFDDGAAAAGPSASHAFTAGRHSATVTVTDLAHFTATSTVAVTVVTRPSITQLKVNPFDLFAATSGPSATIARSPGAVVTYRDSQPATTTFTVLRSVRGVRRHGRCVKPSGHHRGRVAHCSLLVSLGRFTHDDAPGPNRLRFSGRAGGHRLASGGYELRAVPHNVAGSGPPVLTRFHVHH